MLRSSSGSFAALLLRVFAAKKKPPIRAAIKMQSKYLYKYFIVCDCFCMPTSGTCLM